MDIEAIEKLMSEHPGAAETGKLYRELLDSAEGATSEALASFVAHMSSEDPEDDHEPEGGKGGTNDRAMKRAIAWDRSADVEYYTTAQLGPRRELTPEGFLICYDVPAARTGEMLYGPGETPIPCGPQGHSIITRAASEVFAPNSIASLSGKPVTDDHPPVDVAPDNWRFYTRGSVINPRRGEGEHKDFLVVDLIIYDAQTIADISAGKREVSCGYNPDYLEILDDNGQPIVGRGEQCNIIYNHLALVDRGRCGPRCSIGDQRTVDALAEAAKFWSRKRARRLRRLAREASC